MNRSLHLRCAALYSTAVRKNPNASGRRNGFCFLFRQDGKFEDRRVVPVIGAARGDALIDGICDHRLEAEPGRIGRVSQLHQGDCVDPRKRVPTIGFEALPIGVYGLLKGFTGEQIVARLAG